MDANGPLAGIKVIDLSALAPGPFATMVLGDFGADVITVERPGHGASRGGLEELRDYGGARSRQEGHSPLYRSRRSIVIDLKQPEGIEVLRSLVREADVFLEGFRPGTCDRLGIGYETLSRLNQRLVYCSLTGWGSGNDLERKAGHDLNYLAESGLLSITTRPGQRPGIPLNVVADFAAGGLMAAVGILVGLRGRDLTGQGTHVDASMYAGLLAMLQVAPSWTKVGASDPSWGGGILSGAVPFYDCYQTSDGGWMAVGALEKAFFVNLCTGLQRPDLVGWYSEPDRWSELRRELEREFAAATQQQWLEAFADLDAAVSPVRDLADAFERARRRGLRADDDGLQVVPELSAWPIDERRPIVREPGAHAQEILRDHEMDDDVISWLLDRGIVRGPEQAASRSGEVI